MGDILKDIAGKHTKELKELKTMASAIGSDFCAAPGNMGCVSCKVDDTHMLIKRMAAKLSSCDGTRNLNVVNYARLSDWFMTSDPLTLTEGVEATANVELLASTIDGRGTSALVGAHSLLDKYCLHSYDAFVNIACASEQGIGIITRCFLDAAYEWLWLPFNRQPAKVAFMLKEAQRQHQERREAEPQVFFLQNNGVLITGNSAKEILSIHEDIHQRLAKRFKGERSDLVHADFKAWKDAPFTSTKSNYQALAGDENWLTFHSENPTFASDERLKELLDKYPKGLKINKRKKVLEYVDIPKTEACELDELISYSVFIDDKFNNSKLRRLTYQDAAPDFVGR